MQPQSFRKGGNEVRKGEREDSTYILARKSARAAADMHQELAADEHIRSVMAAAAEDTVKPETGIRTIGPLQG